MAQEVGINMVGIGMISPAGPQVKSRAGSEDCTCFTGGEGLVRSPYDVIDGASQLSRAENDVIKWQIGRGQGCFLWRAGRAPESPSLDSSSLPPSLPPRARRAL